MSPPAGPRIGFRAAVLTISAILSAGTAFAVSANVSDHLAQAAIHEAVRTTESVVLGAMQPPVNEVAMANPNGPLGQTIDGEMARLTAAGHVLRIKVWSRTGQVLFSDLPALRGRTFAVDADLGDALAGKISTDISDATDPENEFENGLATRLLSIYLPIRSSDGSTVIGAYEIYEDAAPIEADIASTRTDVLLIVGAMALGLLVLLYAAFSGASRRLASQNRRLREVAATEQLLMTDLRRSEERFRSLVRNSADVNMIVGADGVIVYESPAGRPGDDRAPHPARRWDLPPHRGHGQEPPRRSRRHRRRRQLPRHLRAPASRGRAPPPGVPRFADGPREPGALRRPARARAVEDPAVARPSRGPLPGPRRLQDHQRQPGPR